MAKACKFCYFLNSFVCDNVDCQGCGKCEQSKESVENGSTTA